MSPKTRSSERDELFLAALKSFNSLSWQLRPSNSSDLRNRVVAVYDLEDMISELPANQSRPSPLWILVIRTQGSAQSSWKEWGLSWASKCAVFSLSMSPLLRNSNQTSHVPVI